MDKPKTAGSLLSEIRKKSGPHWLLLVLLLAGCGPNLQEIRNYSKQASGLSAYPELTRHWEGTYEREKLYLFAADRVRAESEHQERQDAVKDLLKIHTTVTLYFAGLGRLAGDKSFSLGDNIDDLGREIHKSGLTGIEDTHIEAYANIVEIVASLKLRGVQRREIGRYIEQGNAPIQAMLAGMHQAVAAYQGTLKNEVARAGFLRFVNRDSAQDRIVAALANIEYARLMEETANTRKRLNALERAISTMADGHQALYDNRDKLGKTEFRQRLKAVTDDLKKLNDELEVLKG